MFKPALRARASDAVVEQIERAIFSGDARPGDRLPSERRLQAEFLVSRHTIRAALQSLEARGLVKIAAGARGGAVVTYATPELVSNAIATLLALRRSRITALAEARTVLEAEAVELAARRRPGRTIEALSADARAATRSHGPGTSSSERARFHLRLTTASGNAVLSATVKAYHQLLPTLDARPTGSGADAARAAHEKILLAVARHDAMGARREMLKHLNRFEMRVRRLPSNRAQRTNSAREGPSRMLRNRASATRPT